MDGPFTFSGIVIAIAAATGLVYRAERWWLFVSVAAVLCALVDTLIAVLANTLIGFDLELFSPALAASRLAYTLILAALAIWYRQLDLAALRLVVCLGTDVLLQGVIYAFLELLLPGAAIDAYRIYDLR
ncbi:MAG: hypothetical protein QNI99_12665 [Woeseiaceae bacterium]|nr:hypothetical protein [Woeseiaceae bacterium]